MPAGLTGVLQAAALGAPVLACHALQGGNHRAWRVDLPGRSVLAKLYHPDAAGERDRQAAEAAFVRHARQRRPAQVAALLACDAQRRLSVFEFVAGRPLQAAEVGAAHLRAAADFVAGLLPADAAALPEGSEACFSMNGHLALVGRRVSELTAALDPVQDRRAAAWAAGLQRAWQRVQQQVRERATQAALALDAELPQHWRCVSPSDFGFHNALLRPDGSLCFIDFEHAGWDDPAKLAGDFFAQVAVPVPADGFDDFVQRAFAGLDDPHLALRCALLRPVYRIKWCCIAMNAFVPARLARLRFARPGHDLAAFREQQLALAERLLAALWPELETPAHGLH